MSLPRGYRRLEYIQSTGTQYIDTMFKPNQNTRVLIDFAITTLSVAWQGIISARDGSGAGFGNNFSLWATPSNRFRTDFGSDGGPTFGTSDTKRHVADKNKNKTTIGAMLAENSTVSFSCNYSLHISTGYSGGNPEYPAKIKLYSCQIYDNGTLVRDFIPCKNTGGAVGLWDDVNSVFYGNAGTGTFIDGPEVDPYGNDEHTLLLLHGEDLKDSSPYGVAIENINVSVSDAQSKFGGKSLYFNGTARILFPEVNFSEADFTIDWWEYVTSSSSGSRFCTGYTSGYDVQGLLLGYKGTRVYAGSAKGTWNLINGVSMLSNTVNQWVHWAFVRKDNTLTAYRNGVQFASTALNGVIFISDNYPSVIGDYRQGDPNPFIGYIDEFRISNIARWTENFTPPTKPYSSSLNLPVNIGGTWKDANEVFVNIGGTWKTVEAAFVNIGGTWKELG